MPKTANLLALSLSGLLLATASLYAAGFPIRRTDSSWGEFSAGLLEDNTFLAAGQAHGTAAGSNVSFVGKWDLDGNPIWEKSTRAWSDHYHSIRRNPDGTYLLLGNTVPQPAHPLSTSGCLFLVLDGAGNTMSRTYATIPSPSAPDSALGDTTWQTPTTYLDFLSLNGRNFLLGRENRYNWPFLAEFDPGFRLIRLHYLPKQQTDFGACRLLPWNGRLLVLGTSGDYWPSVSNRLNPAVLVMDFEGRVERLIDTLSYGGTGGVLTDGMVVGNRVILSGKADLLQLGPDLRIEWKSRIQPYVDESTLLRQDAQGNYLVFHTSAGVIRGHGQCIHAFDPLGNALNSGTLHFDFAGLDFLPAPDGRLLALGLGTDDLPFNVDDAARIHSFNIPPFLTPSVGIGPRPSTRRKAAMPASDSRDAMGRRAAASDGNCRRLLLRPLKYRIPDQPGRSSRMRR